MSQRVIFIQQEKGGTRKTFTAAHISAYLRSNGVEHTLVDADIMPGSLMRLYPGEVVQVEFDEAQIGNPHARCDLEQILLLIHEGKNVVVDWGANTSRGFIDFFVRRISLKDELDRVGAKLTIVAPVDKDPKSADAFTAFASALPWVTLILARVQATLRESRHGPSHPADLTIDIPLCSEFLMDIYRTANLTLDRIAESYATGEHFYTGMYARGALQQVFQNYDRVKQHLLPD